MTSVAAVTQGRREAGLGGAAPAAEAAAGQNMWACSPFSSASQVTARCLLWQDGLEDAPESWPSLGPAEAATEAADGAAGPPPTVPQPLLLGGAPGGAPAGVSFSQVASCQSPALQECVGALLLMGFPEEVAVAAAQAAGAEAEAATALILEQQQAGMWQAHEPAGGVLG